MIKEFEISAVLDGKSWKYFGIHESLVSLYGVNKEDIKTLVMKISDNQNIEDLNKNNADYWGWFDNNKFTLIYPKRFLLEMCFPYGLKVTEKSGRGKSYRLEILKVKK